MNKTLLIMAAGMGSRYGGLKQMDAMGPSGEVLMEYSVYDAIQAGFDKVVFIIKDNMQQDFHDSIGSRLSGHIQVDYAIQSIKELPEGFRVPEKRNKPWGTSQAILSAADKVTTPFAVLNADDFYGREAFSVMSDFLDHLDTQAFQSAMVAYAIKNTLSRHGTVTRGICEDQNGYLKDIVEIKAIGYNQLGQIEYQNQSVSTTLSGDELCSMNIWGFTPHVFDYLKEDFSRFLREKGTEETSEWLIPETVGDMILNNVTRVKILESTDSWFGVTFPDDKPEVCRRIAELVDRGIYPSPLFGEER